MQVDVAHRHINTEENAHGYDRTHWNRIPAEDVTYTYMKAPELTWMAEQMLGFFSD